MEPNKKVKVAMAETRVTLEHLAMARGVTKQAMHQKLQKELPEEMQEELKQQVLDIAKERIHRAEEIA